MLSEIPPNKLSGAIQTNIFLTRDIHVAALLRGVSGILPHHEGFVRANRENGKLTYEFYFEPDQRINGIIGQYFGHVDGSWPARVRDDFHNRQRLIDIAKGSPVQNLTRAGGRLVLETNGAVAGPCRRIAARVDRMNVNDLNLVILLVGSPDLKFSLELSDVACAFSFQANEETRQIILAYSNFERFCEGNDTHLAHRIAALKWRQMIRQELDKIPIRDVVRRDGKIYCITKRRV